MTMLDTSFREGKKDMPLIVFVHGLGMDKHIWTDPLRSKVLAGKFPVDILLRKKARSFITESKRPMRNRISLGVAPSRLESLYYKLNKIGFGVLAWSQRRPAADSGFAVNELRSLLTDHDEHTRNGIVLLGHSRGGLIAKRFALSEPRPVISIISLGSPFMGSSLAKWAKILAKTSFVLKPFLKSSGQKDVKGNINHVLKFINSKAVKELLPDSEFIRSLKKPLSSRIKTLSIAGSSPDLIGLYSWHSDCIKNSKKYRSRQKLLFSFPNSLNRVLPEMMMPEELIDGKGDGLVAVDSALSTMKGISSIHSLNHAALVFNRSVHQEVISFLKDGVAA
ncbi:MAG: hypothetical protein JSV21_00610 [Nitrospirota bacterium]|nr:MAG: hypothetical protein JSV21_00610 [Nitrospirota bacterium]